MKFEPSDRSGWENADTFEYRTLKNATEELARDYLDAILHDINAVIQYIEEKVDINDMGIFYCATEWHSIEELLFGNRNISSKTSRTSVLKRYKEVRDTLSGYKSDVLKHKEIIADIYEHQWVL